MNTSEANQNNHENDQLFEKRKQDFSKITETLESTGLISKIHDMFSKHNIEELYVVSDAYEITAGFPVTALTRTIMITSADVKKEEEEGEQTIADIHTGLVISEIRGLGGLRTVDIQLGLSLRDVEKLALRLRKSFKDLDNPEPYWWRHPYNVIDITKPENLAADSRFFAQGKEMQDIAIAEGAVPIEAYIYNPLEDDEINRFTYEREEKGVIRLDPWGEEAESLAKGLEKLNELIQRESQN